MNFEVLQGEQVWLREHKIGLVTSRFNSEITELLEEGALARLQEMGVPASAIRRVRVPGAYEIPLAAKWLIEKKDCAAVITLGAVIRGETAHFDYVCQAVERGCTMLQLETGRPVVFGVLTTDTDEQAQERVGGKHGHKGRDAADVAIEMLNLTTKLTNK